MPDDSTTPTVFEYRSVVPVSVEHAWMLYEEPDVLARLTPPLIVVRVLRDDRVGIQQGELEFDLWLGPFRTRWITRHEPGPIETSFTDRMLQGPFAAWVHEHIVQPAPRGAELIDRLVIAHRADGLAGLFTRVFFSAPLLRLLFAYRHWRSRQELLANREGGRRRVVRLGVYALLSAASLLVAAFLRRRS